MNDWLAKVEEMKRQRGVSNPGPAPAVTTPPSPTLASIPSPKQSANPFLKKSTAPPVPRTYASQSNTPKSNPFLKQTGVAVSISGPVSTPITTAATTRGSVESSTTTSTPGSTTDVSGARGSADSNGASALGGGIYKVKFEQEAKRRQELEELYAAKQEEVQNLKAELSKARSGVAPKKLTAEERKTRRMTRHNLQSQRMSVHVASSLEAVLNQIGGLDRRIRGAEAARMQAEDKLLEIAIAKLEVDQVIQKVDTVLKKIIEQISNFTTAQLKEMLTKVRNQTQSEEDGASGGSRASVRFSIIVPKGGLELPDAPPPPPPPASGDGAPTKSGLLSQIRQGVPLRNLNIDTLKQEQKDYRDKAKETMASMKSLEDVLRDALTSRVTEMNLYDDEEEDDEW